MIIEICGNLGSGKTTLALSLSAALNWPFVGIDNYRVDGYSESMAKGELLRDVFDFANVVYETTSCNRVHRLIEQMYLTRKVPVLKVLIWADKQLCLNICKTRTVTNSFPYKIDVSDSIDYIHEKLKVYKPDVVLSRGLSVDEMTKIVLNNEKLLC